jgi:hypothetical protein
VRTGAAIDRNESRATFVTGFLTSDVSESVWRMLRFVILAILVHLIIIILSQPLTIAFINPILVFKFHPSLRLLLWNNGYRLRIW